MRGQAFARLGDEDAAAAEFSNAIEAAPRDKDVWTDVARFRRANGDLAGAIVAADKPVRSAAKDVAAITFRGQPTRRQYGDRKSVMEGTRVSVPAALGVSRLIKKTIQ